MKKVIEEEISRHENKFKITIADGTQSREFEFIAPSKEYGQSLLSILNLTPEIVSRISPAETLEFPSRIVSLDTLVTDSDFSLIVDATAGPVTITLPFASTGGKIIIVTKADASGNSVTLESSGLDEFSSGADVVLSSQWSKALLLSDGVNTWIQIV